MKATCPTWLLPEDQWQMVMLFRSVLPLCVAVILGTSCESLTPPDTVNDLYWEVFDQRRNRYEIDEGDTVTIKLFDAEKEQLREQFLTILPDGRSDPFFMPAYRFSGKTIPEVEEDIVEFVKGVERNAEVSIVVLPGPQTVYVGGQVERPGSVVLTPDMTFDEALAVVGGIRVTADSDYVLLRRPYHDPLHPDRFRLDVNDTSADIFLLPSDEIYVQRTAWAGAVMYIREYIFGILPPGLGWLSAAL